MHDCPECGRACTCSGDIEDHDTGDEFYEDCCHECGEEMEEDFIGCLFPDRCVMPGLHLVSECATAEMMEAMYDAGEC